MRFATTVVAFLSLASLLAAQQQKPYSNGDVAEFLEAAQSNGRPAVVLFNFNLESG